MKRRACALLGFLIGMGLPAAGWGQIDYRVNNQVGQQSGQLLDRNYQIGGGTVNPPIPWAFDAGLRANAIATGNVTGLAGFRGFSPIANPNEFRDTLPSATLSGFTARSVGLSDVQSFQVPQPTLFYDPRTNIADAGMIQQGLNMPGSSFPISSQVVPQSYAAGQTELNQLLQIEQPEFVDQRPGAFVPNLGLRQRDIEAPQERLTIEPLSANSTPTIYDAASTSSIFGVPEWQRAAEPGMQPGIDVKELQERLQQQTGREMPSNQGPRDVRDAVGLAPERMMQPPVDPLLVATSELRAERERGDPLASDRSLGVVYLQPREQAAGAVTAAPPGSIASVAEADVYSGMVHAYLSKQETGERPTGFAAAAKPVNAAVSETSPRPSGTSADRATEANAQNAAESTKEPRKSATETPSETALAAKWADEALDAPVTTFAGRYENDFNQYMSKAEQAMREGRYYVAAQLYGLANSIDPRNPLPLLGRGHAYVATGDYLSAFETIRQGISQFPQIAAFRLDLPAMVGQADVFDLRRSDLEKRLKESEYYKLRFLLGYLELYSGLVDEGIRDLTKASEGAPAGDVVAIFPDLLLGKRELPALGEQGGNANPGAVTPGGGR